MRYINIYVHEAKRNINQGQSGFVLVTSVSLNSPNGRCKNREMERQTDGDPTIMEKKKKYQ